MPELLQLPPRASTLAGRVDDLFTFALLVSLFFSVLIAALLVYFGIKYRMRPDPSPGGARGVGVTPGSGEPLFLEIAWAAVPLAILLGMFYEGARVFLELSLPPADAEEYFVVARQWMWKVQHPDGPREINELHAPVGRPIKLTMTSEDVIHSFYVPAFRIKQDVLPGRYTTVWFEAEKAGTYHLFCTEYCGTEHSKMVGRVIVMEPARYEEWLAGGGQSTPVAVTGEGLFQARGCPTCHRPDTAARAPILNGLVGRTVELADGESLVADEEYVRESILRPRARLVAGYPPIMPAYEGQLSEEEILALISYVRSLPEGAPGGETR